MKTQNWGKLALRLIPLLLALALIWPWGLSQADAAPPKPRIHPTLAKMLDDDPNGTVSVIVQGKNKNGDLDSKVDKKGGKNKKSLAVARSVAADLPADKVRELAEDPDVNWITLDATMVPTVQTDALGTVYPLAVKADGVWNGSTSYTGAGVTVAVLDSGIHSAEDFKDAAGHNRLLKGVSFNTTEHVGVGKETDDKYGHGTHVAGIIAGSGRKPGGKYIGIAPDAKLISVKVSDSHGEAHVSDVIYALQWAILNRAQYNIRVINLSLVSSVPESYLTSPLDAAVELAWLSGIVVVVSAGNGGPDSMLYPPANDPFVITVGAADTNDTANTADDTVPGWSGYGQTPDGFAKPEVVAPGRRIVSVLAASNSTLGKQYRDRIVDEHYLRLSGTSMAAPVVSGIAALALQAHPNWTPDQVKAALIATTRPLAQPGSGAGEVDALAVVSQRSPSYANAGLPFALGVAGLTGSLNYSAATWNAATWNSATWNAATWNSATWNSATWNSATWNSAYPD